MKTDNIFLKNYWLWVVLIVVGGVFFLFFKVDLPADRLNQSYLVLDFGDNMSRKFQGSVAPDMTILEALYSASVNGRFDFRYFIDKNGTLEVAKIGNAVKLNDKPSWHFYLNGQSVDTTDINKTKIKTGDLIEAKYE